MYKIYIYNKIKSVYTFDDAVNNINHALYIQQLFEYHIGISCFIRMEHW